VYSSTGVPVAFALANWSRVSSDDRAPGERRVSRVIFIGVAVGLTLASLTDVLLPALGAPVPQLSVPVLTGVIVAVAVTLKRFGFSILSPAAFAEEILESLADGVVLLRPNGRIRRANPAFVRLVGLGETDLRDRPLADWVPDWSRSADQTDARWEEGEVEMHLQPAGGPPVPVSVSSCALVRNLGARLGSAVIVRDLRQVAWLRERLVTTGRLAAVGELSAGIAHEIQAPVAKVEQELGALRRHWLAIGSALEKSADGGDDVGELLAEGEELVEECLEGVHRVTSIVADVAGLAEPGATTREPVDVNEVIGRALRMAIPRDARGLAVEQRLDRLPPVLAVAPQLEQVFTNLIRNAVHAVGERGRITVESGWRDGKVEVRVVDDGPGIDPAIRSRIFDPFFTTKPVGEGTGLGLAISYHIVRSHDGQIRAESDGARGAVFTVELPAARGRGAESDEVV
jgi:PAS domain S-box-containing protein